MVQYNINNFIKYCLGYIRLTRQKSFIASNRNSTKLTKEQFSVLGLLNGDTDGSIDELIKLETFYSYLPKDITGELKEVYEREKTLAESLEDIAARYKNDSFTKQVLLNFGYFEVELPIDEPEDSKSEEAVELQLKKERFPLFSIPINIDKKTVDRSDKYFVINLDPEILVNISILDKILAEDAYFALLDKVAQLENDGQLSVPITTNEVFYTVWQYVKDALKISGDINFNDQSFVFDDEVSITLTPKANYFLAEDLIKLSKLDEENLKDTALSTWVSDENLNSLTEVPNEDDLYFPFRYDRYQVKALSVLGNQAAIVEGPPGTGKSETISNVLCHLAATGKRVLFVSQKAQALKVVKDKLKRTNIDYLFAYVPNPNSEQITSEDLTDGIAAQLTSLGQYIGKMLSHSSYKKSAQNNGPAINKQVYQQALDDQHKFFDSYSEYTNLKVLDIPELDKSLFQNMLAAEFDKAASIVSKLGELDSQMHQIKDNADAQSYHNKFSQIAEEKNYYATLELIAKDIEDTGFDRHSTLAKKLNVLTRNLRLRSLRSKLPREIIDQLDALIDQDASRRELVKQVNNLVLYFKYFDLQEQSQELEANLAKLLSQYGLDRGSYSKLNKVVNEVGGFDTAYKKIHRYNELKLELNALLNTPNTNTLRQQFLKTDEDRRHRIVMYIQNIINTNLLTKWNGGVTIKQIVKKLGRAFGKSKKAFKTFDAIRKDASYFDTVLDLVPIWIMELDDASRLIPLEPGMFDYVILDEASQCNIAYTLPVMFRAKHALFVGDSEQMRDNTIMFKSNRSFDDLARRYEIPEELQIKASGTAVQSVIDIANLRGLQSIPLRFHYRSPAELIGFSNKYFYKPKGKELIPLNNSYLPYADTERVLLIHEVSSDRSNEISDKVNIAEAEAILDFFKKLRSDERYREKSVGILSFFDAQATYIRKIFTDAKLDEERDNYKISIVEGIQGDEKDIILYSFVIRSPDMKNKYQPLTGEGGDIKGDINQGRVNVAFSRARLQAHCFISMPVKDFPEGIWIKRYLKYVEEQGKLAIYNFEIQPFDSLFEEEFYNLAKINFGDQYRIQNQIESCGFKIDFVITNPKNGKRVAVECDGPTHFADEIDEMYGMYVESDEERQGVLEAAGWSFYRIKYSDWLLGETKQKKFIQELEDLLA